MVSGDNGSPPRFRRATDCPHGFGGYRGDVKARGASSTCGSVLVHSLVEGGLLLGIRFPLVLGLPLFIGHAVDRFAALVLAESDPGPIGLLLHPVGQAVAA